MANYGYTKLLDLFESISHVVQVSSWSYGRKAESDVTLSDHGGRYTKGHNAVAQRADAALHLRPAQGSKSAAVQTDRRDRFPLGVREGHEQAIQRRRIRAVHLRGSPAGGTREYDSRQ